MKVVRIVLFVFAIATLAAAEQRPQIPESFQASGHVTVKIGTEVHAGDGYWGKDAKTQMSRNVLSVVNGSVVLEYTVLSRYDLHKVYTISTKPVNKCEVSSVNGSLPDDWSWVDQAKFIKKEKINGVEADLWEYIISGVKIQVGVKSSNVNEPIYFSSSTNRDVVTVNYASWKPTAPASSFFTVPSFCPK
eukprot:TRINITY_DN89_c0_g1_i1.p1 TRINITY_DN89_c0_g1~~TRINITY_DN89_c0_g1_i1.p1  ORF type:complete len:190 (-),score=32.97 TRINITY_DN89_c0_g1_i1:188-757(-)